MQVLHAQRANAALKVILCKPFMFTRRYFKIAELSDMLELSSFAAMHLSSFVFFPFPAPTCSTFTACASSGKVLIANPANQRCVEAKCTEGECCVLRKKDTFLVAVTSVLCFDSVVAFLFFSNYGRLLFFFSSNISARLRVRMCYPRAASCVTHS